MTYGIRRTNRHANFRGNSFAASARTGRRTTYKAAGVAARRAKVAALRAVRTTKGRKAAITKNTARIKRLEFNQWGRVQSQVSTLSESLVPHRDHPLLFHVNNPVVNHHGPYVWTLGATLGEPTATNAYFELFQGDSDHDMNANDDFVKVNGPKLKMLWATYQFKFSGFLQDCRIRIDVIRQKTMTTDFYNQNKAKQFLPNTLDGFKGLAGFSPNEIDKSKFQIIKTKYVYLNSAASSNLVDTAEDRATTEATTAPSKYCRISLKLNKIIKQIVPTKDELTGDDAQGEGRAETQHPNHSSWCYDNQHPLSNIWVLISCDDTRTLNEIPLGERVTVDIIRKLTWQDRD